ncbi:hypothetical protein CZ787_12475 [Halomonas citrativorans]|uniref:Uncharacterized protein n=1 Tax=Halomonas citrativorans TaxID=2742612 RepID=A0A1R4I2D9_9GAMM|nr:hypothetical protein CZ787_12475 [Halomonas citrativorans]
MRSIIHPPHAATQMLPAITAIRLGRASTASTQSLALVH